MSLATNRNYQTVGVLPLSNSYGIPEFHRIYSTVARYCDVRGVDSVSSYRCFLLPIYTDNYGPTPKGQLLHQKKTIRNYRDPVSPLSDNYGPLSRLPHGIGYSSGHRIYRYIYETKQTGGLNREGSVSPQRNGGAL